MAGLKAQGVEEFRQEEYWVTGRKGVGWNGFAGLWERGRPPRLKMLEDMHNKTLDELDSLMDGVSQEWSGRDQGDDREEEADGEGGRAAAVVARWNVMAAFVENSDDGQEEGGSRRLSSVMVGNDSSFVPSRSDKGR